MNINLSDQTVSGTEKYAAFSSEVYQEILSIARTGEINKERVESFLNGAAANALDTYVSRKTRSANGIYFSGHELSNYVALRLSRRLKKGATVADPACGAGDLLLACAMKFKAEKTFFQTVRAWEKKLLASDLHASFIEATKARLTLLAAKKFVSKFVFQEHMFGAPEKFNKIKTADFFSNVAWLSNVDCVVMNPPFITTDSPMNCSWAKGKIQLAGVFVDAVLSNAKKGQEIVAILPDVLRSGTRYARWREFVSANAQIKDIFVYGRFDQKTDVDVFVLHLIKGRQKSTDPKTDWTKVSSALPEKNLLKTADRFFHVTVGAYVPFRAKEFGKKVSYLSVSGALPDIEAEAKQKCIFDGTLHKTPFVVVRRTSNPSDPRRIIPSLITGPHEVAVENHLIVFRPIDGTLNSCKKLMKLLIRPEVDEWVNKAIRCRHLTTTVLKTLPLVDWK